jgi:RNA-directed DNA polymerase
MNWMASLRVAATGFVRYADDGNIYVRSEQAGRRVMASLTRFIERRLKLQIKHGEECCRPTVAPVVPRLHGQG